MKINSNPAESINFNRITKPVEALFVPPINMVTVPQTSDQPILSFGCSVTVDKDSFSYVKKAEKTSIEVSRKPGLLQKAEKTGIRVLPDIAPGRNAYLGNIGESELFLQVSNTPQGMHIAGRIGEVETNLNFVSPQGVPGTPANPKKEVVKVQGMIGGERYQETYYMADEGQDYFMYSQGQLGDMPIKKTVALKQGTYLEMEGTVGEHTFDEMFLAIHKPQTPSAQGTEPSK